VETPAAVVPAAEDVVEGESKTRVVPTRDSVMTDFSEILSLVDAEIERLRDGSDKPNSAKFLRQMNRRLRSLQGNTARILKHKAPSARRNNNSGFLKPVNISGDIAKFTGLDPKTQHSRVDVTKFLCKYIKDKNLQNPADKRQINADPALSKLLNYDSKTTGEPLTYYHMQRLLKNHFTKTQ
jgi:chromatin remodeling complex protein RSC6